MIKAYLCNIILWGSFIFSLLIDCSPIKSQSISTQTYYALSLIEGGDITHGINELQRLSKANDIIAQFYLGECFEIGIGVDKNIEEAFKFYRRTAERGLPDGMFKLFEFYKNGTGNINKQEKANFWYNKFVQKGGEKLLPDLTLVLGELQNSHENNNEAGEKYIDKRSDGIVTYRTQNEDNNSKNYSFTPQEKERIENKDNSNLSYVDKEIPYNSERPETNTFAIIIANEDYHSVSKVPYAVKDGEIIEKYLTRAIGLPKDHVKIYKNASFGNIAAALKHIRNLSEAFGEDLNLIFYYAGHGMPNEKTKSPMLLPVDGDAAIPETCYELDKVITTLGGLNANSVIMFLDACFSGTGRDEGMLLAARGIRIKTNSSEPTGNMVIFSASQGDETAYPFDAEQHGLFTYYLLKKIQENKGDVTLGELTDYTTEQVKRQSVVSNGKLQTPSISVSPTLKSSWRDIKLK